VTEIQGKHNLPDRQAGEEIGVFLQTLGSRFRGLRFNFGIEFKYLLDYELINELSSGKETIEFEVDISTFDLPFKVGMDYKIDENLGVSFQAYIGVVKINKSFTPELRRMYNQGFKFGFYYLF